MKIRRDSTIQQSTRNGDEPDDDNPAATTAKARIATANDRNDTAKCTGPLKYCQGGRNYNRGGKVRTGRR